MSFGSTELVGSRGKQVFYADDPAEVDVATPARSTDQVEAEQGGSVETAENGVPSEPLATTHSFPKARWRREPDRGRTFSGRFQAKGQRNPAGKSPWSARRE